MLAILSTVWNVALIIIGFGLVIAVHELGHFLAAKWAGVRVHAFAVGFGGALCSWRKGLGFRWGSSEKESARLIDAARPGASSPGAAVSPTEYRLNWFPFGGYVKMLGQEDLSPIGGASSADSFAAQPVYKRAVIMSGGVAMNLLLAGVLFVIAYMTGIKEIAPIIGGVTPGSPAEAAGLRAGDRVLAIDGEAARTFLDFRLASAMSGPDESLRFTVERFGSAEPLTVEVSPTKGADGMRQIGVYPAAAPRLLTDEELGDAKEFDAYRRLLQDAGLGALQPGMRLVRVNGVAIAPAADDDGAERPHDIPTADPLRRAIEGSGGTTVEAVFADDAGREVAVVLRPEAELQRSAVSVGADSFQAMHLAGLTPVMRVAAVEAGGTRAGLLPGDVFARIGSVEWPSVALGVAEVRKYKGRSVDLAVLRDGETKRLSARVDSSGRIGFLLGDTASDATLIGAAPAWPDDVVPPAGRLAPGIVPGSRVVRVAGVEVSDFRDMRVALRDWLARDGGLTVPMTVELPIALPEDGAAREEISLSLTDAEAREIGALSWDAAPVIACFGVAQFTDRARDPWHALTKGVAKTHSVVMMTYVTFLRLFQGTVPVDQLHGPVGITHIGSQVAAQGMISLLFFLGLISANLAVINFLPLPIFDGGHMVFLAIEAITRRPVSVAVQNVAIVAGLVLIATVFVVVTFNDLVRLLG